MDSKKSTRRHFIETATFGAAGFTLATKIAHAQEQRKDPAKTMGKHLLKDMEVPLEDWADVIVAGGGPSGCTAAIAAAREGAKTLLVEATGALGGMGTSGLVPAWCPFSDGEKVIYKGLAERIFNLSKKETAFVDPEMVNWVPIDPEALKRIYDRCLAEAGVSVLFNTSVSAVEHEQEGSVSTLIVSNKAGLSALKAKIYVDCTGDGDVAVRGGASFEAGGEEGEVQPATHCFTFSNVDTEGYRKRGPMYSGNPKSPIWAILESKKYPHIIDSSMNLSLQGPGTVGFNAGHIFGKDFTDPKVISESLIEGRKIAKSFRDALAEFAPDVFAEAHLAATAPLLGIRESRRVLGDYVLTWEDYQARRSFPDEIGRNCYRADIHGAKGKAKVAWDKKNRYQKGESHGIPYRCLTPKDLTNVLVAGRCISTDRIVQGSTRVMPVCLVTGEAAGLAAALAAQGSGDVHRVDTALLREKLKSYGAYFL